MDRSLDELVKLITYRLQDRLTTVRALSLSEQSAVFELLSPHVQQWLLKELKTGEIVDLLDHMDIRRAEGMVARIVDVKQRSRIVRQLKSDARNKIEYFLRFHPKATITLINFNYLFLSASLTIGATADAIEEHHHDTGRFPEVLVHDRGTLLGEVSMSALVRERNNQSLKKYVTQIQSVTYTAEITDIMRGLTESKKKKVVVLDQDESVLGIIYADEALSLFGKLPEESLYDVAGVDDSERPFDGALFKFRNRYRWLILNLFTCFIAGYTIYFFKDTVDALVVLAMYIPIVAGMGGNAASQTFAVMLRGITLGSISLKNCWPAVWREVGAGFINGLVIGLIVALISVVWNGSPTLGLVVGSTMVGVHLIAGFFGAIVPILLKQWGKDPASTSTIFISTATDVGSLMLLLGLGTLFLM